MGLFHYNKKGYPKYNNSGKFVHISVMRKKIGGKIPRGMVVSHKDGNSKNFRSNNLEVVTRKQHYKETYGFEK